MKKFVYVLNSYSDNDAGHYKHIINLLNELSKRNVDVVLFVENLRDVPTQLDSNIQVFSLSNYRNIVVRTIDTLFLIVGLYRKGYKLFFVRISKYPAIMALLIRIIYPDLRIYFWLSGQGMFEKYRAMNFGLRKCRFYFLEMLPFTIISKRVTKFVTGPESMYKYFVKHGVPDHKVLIMYNDIDLSIYTPVDNLGMKTDPLYSFTPSFVVGSYNTYGIEWFPDKIDFLVNGTITFTYPRKASVPADQLQWPFDQPFYLILNQALGGSWVGKIDDSVLPVQSEIDYVKVYGLSLY